MQGPIVNKKTTHTMNADIYNHIINSNYQISIESSFNSFYTAKSFYYFAIDLLVKIVTVMSIQLLHTLNTSFIILKVFILNNVYQN